MSNIEVIDEIVPKNNGAFAILRDAFLRGGFRAVDLLLDRDAIPSGRRASNMPVYVAEDDVTYRMPAGDLDDNLRWVVASGSGVGIDLGTILMGLPTDGDYSDGAVTISPTDTGADAIDAINEFLAAISPTQPGDLAGLALVLAGTVLFSARLPSGLAAAWGTYTPGDLVSNLIVDNTYTLSTPNPTTRFSDDQTANPEGQVTNVLDGVDGNTRLISAGVGIDGAMEITAVDVFNTIWRKVNARIAFTQLTEGEALHAIRHNPASGSPDQTADFAVLYDDQNSAPAFGVVPSHVVSVEVLRPLSGINYYAEGTTFTVDFEAAIGIFQKAYHPTEVAQLSVPGASNVSVNPAVPPAVNDAFTASAGITLIAGAVAVLGPNVSVTLRKPDGANTVATDALARGINTYSAGASTSVFDLFVDELQRLQLGSAVAWVSSAVLVDGNAQARNGLLVHGADGDYGAFVADGVFERIMAVGVASGGTVRLNGITAATIGGFGTGTFNVLLQLETDGVWFDLGTDFGVNNGDGTGSSPANSKGARISSSGGDLVFSFGLFSTGTNGNEYRIQITFRGANGLALNSVEAL